MILSIGINLFVVIVLVIVFKNPPQRFKGILPVNWLKRHLSSKN